MTEINTSNTLALKYRPRKFKEVAGHKSTVKQLEEMIKSNAIPNALAFLGRSGTGKCISGDSLIYTNEGIKRIDSIISRQDKDRVDGFKEYKGNLKLLNLKGEYESPSHTYIDSANTISIKLGSGHTITGTHNHPVLVLKSGYIFQWIKLQDIRIGDSVAVSCAVAQTNLVDKAVDSKTIEEYHPDNFISTKDIVDYILTAGDKEFKLFIEHHGSHYNMYNKYRYEEARVLQLRLQTLGIYIELKHRYVNSTTGEMECNISFGQHQRDTKYKPKIQNLDELILLSKTNTVYSPNSINYSLPMLGHEIPQDSIKKIVKNSKFIPVVSIKDAGLQLVYDFTMPETHSFVANGIINHNTTFARMIARYINCEKGTSCGKCDSCKAIDAGKSSDYMEVNCATDGGIDNIKSIINQANFQPRNKLRVIVMDECHKLSNPASNALLKPVESPPSKTLWVFATSEPDSISNGSALLGRCQLYRLSVPTPEEIAHRLDEISEMEKFKWAKESLLLDIAGSTNGQVRDAIQLLEKCALYAKNSKLKGKELRKEIIGEVISGDVNTLDETCHNILMGIFTANFEVIQRAVLDSDGEYIGLMNKIMFCMSFILSINTIKGKHAKIWWTPLNRKIVESLKKHKIKLDIEDIVHVYSNMNKLKEAMMKFSTDSNHIMSVALIETAIYFADE